MWSTTIHTDVYLSIREILFLSKLGPYFYNFAKEFNKTMCKNKNKIVFKNPSR